MWKRDARRTADAPTASKTLLDWYGRSATTNAELGRETYTRMVREPGARWFKKFTSSVCVGLLFRFVVGPASSKRIRRFASAAARRPATSTRQCRLSHSDAHVVSRMKSGRNDDWEVKDSDGSSPAITTSYSSLIAVGVDIDTLHHSLGLGRTVRGGCVASK